MTKEAALTNFFESFASAAYEETNVPSDAEYPRITYSVSIGEPMVETALYASVWYYSEAWVNCNAKVEEIRRRLGAGGILIPCDNGAIWLKRGSPFALNMPDENDMIRRKYLNIVAQYIVND